MTFCFCLKIKFSGKYKCYNFFFHFNTHRLYSSAVMLQRTLPHSMILGFLSLLFFDSNKSSPLLPIVQPLISATFWIAFFNNAIRKRVTESLHSSTPTEMTYNNINNVETQWYFQNTKKTYILQCLCNCRCYHTESQMLILLW